MATTKVQSELIVDDVALAGNPTTTTQSAGNNTTRIATTAFVTTAVNNLVDSAPGTMDTLNEIAAALNDDANFNTTVTNAIATKLNLSGGTLTGALTGTTGAFVKASSGGSATSNTVLTIEDDDNTELSILGGSSSVLAINFGHSGDNDEGIISFNTTSGSEDLGLSSSKDITYKVTSTNATAGHHIFKSYNTEIMRIDGGTNKVGIGTGASPGYTLEVKKAVDSDWLSRIYNTGTTDASGLLVRSDTAASQATAVLAAYADGAYRFMVRGNGLVGIGTASPSEELHVTSDVSGQHTRIHVTKTSTAGTAGISFNTTSSANTWTLYQEDASASKFYIYDGSAAVLTLDSADDSITTEKVKISGTSNDEGIYLGANHRIYGSSNARAFEAGSAVQVGEGYEDPGIKIGGTGYANWIRKSADKGSLFHVGGGIGANANVDGMPSMAMSAAFDNAASEGLKFWVNSTTSEWRPCVIYGIGASTQNVLTGQTAGWVCFRATHYNGGISANAMDSGGGGNWSLNDLGGTTTIEMQLVYTGTSNNRTVVAGWCANYGTIDGVVRA